MNGTEGIAQMQKPPQFVADYSTTGQAPSDGRFDAPPFHRNHDPIWRVLEPSLAGRTGEALEVGSGTGQHVTAFARRSPAITWIPSDHLDAHLNSIVAWRADSGLQNIATPRRIDLADPAWATAMSGARFLAIVCINVLHISPWRVSENLIGEAAKLLRPEGRLFVYGPFKRDGQHIAPSNAAFDQSLREKNPDWGVRDATELGALARRCGLTLADIVTMPANNFTLVFVPA
jgi:SAM-dependent methyltransferase